MKNLSRKYPVVIDLVDELVKKLIDGEQLGDKIPHVGYDVYKVRLKNPSANKGKSGGFRVIYYVQLADQIYLLSIYSKSQQEDIDVKMIRDIIENIEEQ